MPVAPQCTGLHKQLYQLTSVGQLLQVSGETTGNVKEWTYGTCYSSEKYR